MSCAAISSKIPIYAIYKYPLSSKNSITIQRYQTNPLISFLGIHKTLIQMNFQNSSSAQFLKQKIKLFPRLDSNDNHKEGRPVEN